MHRTRRVAAAAQARVIVRDLLNRLGPALLIGAGAGCVLVVAQRVTGAAISWMALAGAPVGVAVLYAAAATLVRRSSLLAAAAEVDRALGLRDRLSTAIALERSAGRDAFA